MPVQWTHFESNLAADTTRSQRARRLYFAGLPKLSPQEGNAGLYFLAEADGETKVTTFAVTAHLSTDAA